MAAILVGLLWLFLAQPAAPAEQWLRVNSENFELFTTAGEKSARQGILYFEQVRGFFLKVLGDNPGFAQPVRLVAFRSEKEYLPYRSGENVTAYYQPGQDRDYIVMMSLGSQFYHSAVHEYVHLLIKHSGMKIPLWLNEGFAEVYGTLTPMGDKVRVGTIIAGWMQVLEREKWLHLETLFEVDHKSSHYNEKDRRGVFYAQSWALTHMLNLFAPYRSGFPAFMRFVASGTSHADALQRVYGKSAEQVGKDLQLYLRGHSFNAALFDAKLEKPLENPKIQAAGALEAGLVLAKLLTRKKDAARETYRKLAAEHPKSWEVEEALGYLEWMDDNQEAARPHFARAVELGCRTAKTYMDYAMLLRLGGSGQSSVIPLLRKAVELQPDFREAHYHLGFALLDQKEYSQALNHLVAVKVVSEDKAVNLFRAMAWAFLQVGNREEAQKAAKRARDSARKPDEIASLDEFLRYLTNAPTGAPATGGQPVKSEEAVETSAGGTPRLVRRPTPGGEPAPPESKQPGVAVTTLEGILDQVDCLGEVARLRIVFQGRRVMLAIRDPKQVVVNGTNGEQMNLPCGVQDGARVVVEYVWSPDGKLGTSGNVTAIRFR